MKLSLWCTLACCCLLPASAREANPFADLSHWVVEQMPGGRVAATGEALVIEDVAGCTVWWKEKLTAPVEISYTATVIEAGGPNDRVSDLNCFWMASDPDHPDDLFRPGHGRTGKFETYDQLQTYYVGYGGHTNTRTRFRRYAGGGPKPLLPEHDLQAVQFLLQPNKPYHIRLIVSGDGRTQYLRDGEVVFDFTDPQPLTEGWFGFRTVHSHIRIQDFRIRRLK